MAIAPPRKRLKPTAVVLTRLKKDLYVKIAFDNLVEPDDQVCRFSSFSLSRRNVWDKARSNPGGVLILIVAMNIWPSSNFQQSDQ